MPDPIQDPKQRRISADGKERRVFNVSVSFRAKEGSPGILEGYAALFNQETVIGSYYGFREVIAPGAFADAIKNDDVRGLFNHNSDIVLGRNTAKTLRLEEDATGLRYEIDMPDTSWGRDVRTSVERGDVTGSSFAFSIENDEDDVWDYTPVKDGMLPLRTIKKVTLYDVSPVTYPAYEGTSVSARSTEKASENIIAAAAAVTAPAPVDPGVDPAPARGAVSREKVRAAIQDARACQA